MSDKKQPLNEKDSRARLIGWARKYGCEADLLKIFATYDDLLKSAKTKEEKDAISILGCQAIDNFFGGQGQFSATPKSQLNNFGKLK